MEDTVNAFKHQFTLKGAAIGPLSGLTFGAKDLFDIAGKVTGCGNPEWEKTHLPATEHAPAVKTLLNAGATLLGKTHTDELAYSLMGANAHYGTPTNSADHRRVPGGSSSGSAAAVAAGLVDIGLGSDTGGSVRLPASFCGVWGIRTTFGALSLEKAMPFTRDFDTIGWFAKTPELMMSTAQSFNMPKGALVKTVLFPVDVWARADARTVEALAPLMAKITAEVEEIRPIVLAPEGLLVWRETFRIIQAAQIWQIHADWILANTPNFGPGIAERFELASKITNSELRSAMRQRDQIAERLSTILQQTAALIMPTSPGPAPFTDATAATLDDFRMRSFDMLCIAGLAGLPQITMPVDAVDNGPVGLSVVGVQDQDRALIEFASRLKSL